MFWLEIRISFSTLLPGGLDIKIIPVNAPIATKVVCFSRLLKCLSLSGAICSESTLFASMLNLSVMVGNYLQQMTSADDICRCIFFLAL